MLAAGHVARLGGLEFGTMDSTSAFIEYDLVVHGDHVADSNTLSTANHESTPIGWRLVRATVPEVLLDYSATHANLDFELRVRTPEDSFANVPVRSFEASQ